MRSLPPTKQCDYAYLLHIVRSLRSTGKGGCILPHLLLFRCNAEADIRRALVRKGYIKGIIPDRLYCFATSRSMVSFTSSPTTAVGNFAAIPNAVRLIVVVPEKPE